VNHSPVLTYTHWLPPSPTLPPTKTWSHKLPFLCPPSGHGPPIFKRRSPKEPRPPRQPETPPPLALNTEQLEPNAPPYKSFSFSTPPSLVSPVSSSRSESPRGAEKRAGYVFLLPSSLSTEALPTSPREESGKVPPQNPGFKTTAPMTTQNFCEPSSVFPCFSFFNFSQDHISTATP